MSLGIERNSEETHESTRRGLSLGKYRLFARLGTGGMAEVYLAVAQGAMNVNRLVVIKRLRDEQAGDPGAREMFLNEARLAARLNHPNVIQTFEAGNQGGSYFLAMEYVDGQPLSRVLSKLKREGTTLEPRLAARICADALNGLHYAHELEDFDGTALEIVHRDVSPQNVMLTYEGMIKLVDFGIAKAVGTAQTAHGVFKGKVAFMAPEQLVGDNVDRRADLFAAGIVLWETVTGKPLMAEDSPAKTLYNLMNKQIPRASEVNPKVAPALDEIIARSLERDPAQRYQTAKEMRDALEAFIVSTGRGASHQEIGDLMKGLFADTREKVQAQIKGQLTALSFRKSDPSLETAHDLSHTGIRATGPVLIDLGDAFGGDTVLSTAGLYRVSTGNGTMPAPAPSRTKRLAFGAWIAITVLAVGASGLALFRSQQAPAAPTAVAAAEPAPRAISTSTSTTAAETASHGIVSEAASAGDTSTSAASAAPARSATPAPPAPKAAWVAPPPPPAVHTPPARVTVTGSSTPQATESPKPPPAAQPASTKPQEQPQQGRTFRRDL